MKIKFMGTAAAEGFPALFCKCDVCTKARKAGGKNIRTRTCTMIDDNILIDFGPDTLTHVNNHGLDLTALDAIFITHSHDDHIYALDLDRARPPYGHFKTDKKIKVCGNQTIQKIYEAKIQENESMEFIKVKPFETFEIDRYKIHPLLATHGDADEDCILYAIEYGGKTFLNGNDTNIFPEETWNYLKHLKLDAVALDTTVGINPAKPPSKSGHMNIETVKKVKDRMIEMGCADESTIFIMNHFSHNGGLLHHQFEDMGKEIGFIPAFDGYTVEI